MSLRQLGERSGVNASTISRILRDGRRPTLRTAMAIVRVMHGATDETSATRYFGSPRGQPDPVAAVEHSLRADPTIGDQEVSRILQLYLALRGEAGRVRRAG